MIQFENIKALFANSDLKCSDFVLEKESQDYDACQFKLNGIPIHYRKGKITPKKEGQFVTFWKRIPSGIIAPFEENDNFHYLMVAVESETDSGFFIFSESILVKHKIISTLSTEGKRAFRIYPSWSIPKNKQAIASQKWQLPYFSNKEYLSRLLL